jgi:hypothetical protein
MNLESRPFVSGIFLEKTRNTRIWIGRLLSRSDARGHEFEWRRRLKFGAQRWRGHDYGRVLSSNRVFTIV